MLAKCRQTVADFGQRVILTMKQAFWTVFYFFYFLVKGNPNWKCERYSVETLKNCCVEARKTEQEQRAAQKSNLSSCAAKNYEHRGVTRKSVPSRISEWLAMAKDFVVYYATLFGRLCKRIACQVIKLLVTFLQCLWAIVRAMFWPNVESKRLRSSAPKPFKVYDQDPPSFNRVDFKPEESTEQRESQFDQPRITSVAPELGQPRHRGHPTPAERIQMYAAESAAQQQIATPVAMPRQTQFTSEPFWQHEDAPGPSTHQFTDTSLDVAYRDTSSNEDEATIHAPPPPAPPPPYSSIRLDHVNGREETSVDPWEYNSPLSATTKKEPPGIGKLPADVMAELHGTQKMRMEKETSVQREMTQSCHPDMAQWKTQDSESRYDRSATATPFRASSVGPTMRKLEQVVSRLDDANENEAQYVFRAKPSDYMMGRPVFTPLEEAERMRDTINRNSRPVTPAHSVVSGRMTPYGQETYTSHSYRSEEDGGRKRARTVGPIGRDSVQRKSGFYAMSPYTSHTARRTPIPFDRGVNFAYDRDKVTQGVVSNQVRRWPPASNATGAEVTKDDWIKEIAKEQDNDLITTMCRRVVERKTEDNWKWRDDRGYLLDERNQRSWKGELDTVLRDGPGEARHWSRKVEVLPSGDTRFQDVSRQYNRDYVVEA
ncbi:hypothetical protein V3C99_006584, partial [Haemonchus contortus]